MLAREASPVADEIFCPLRELRRSSYVLNDRDAKFCVAFDDVLASEGLCYLRLPSRIPRSERIRGTLDALRHTRVALPADPVRCASYERLHPALKRVIK